MKKLLLATILLFASNAFAQEKFEISEVIQADGLNKTDIYVALRAWVASTYNSANDVIQMDDKDAGIIICSALFDYSYGKLQYKAYEGVIKYTLKLQIKDGRFKADFSNFIHQNNPRNAKDCNLGPITTAEEYTNKGMTKGFHNKVWTDIKEKADTHAKLLFDSLKKTITQTKPVNNKSDSW